MGRFWIVVDSVYKGMNLIIRNHVGYGASLEWILKFIKNVWINVDSLQTHFNVRSRAIRSKRSYETKMVISI